MPTRVLLVDDHALVRQAVAAVLATSPGINVVGEAGTGRDAIERCQAMSPDVVVLDVELPDMTGAAVAKAILSRCPTVRVTALTIHGDRRNALEMLRAGALGYVCKIGPAEEILVAIEAVAAGRRYVSPDVASEMLGNVSTQDHSVSSLTRREVEMLRALATGLSIKETALKFGLGVKTVETHRRSIMEKLQIFNVAELTKHAIREGLTSLD